MATSFPTPSKLVSGQWEGMSSVFQVLFLISVQEKVLANLLAKTDEKAEECSVERAFLEWTDGATNSVGCLWHTTVKNG